VNNAEGTITELHIGFKGTMNALFLQDLAQKTHRGQRGRIEAASPLAAGVTATMSFDEWTSGVNRSAVTAPSMLQRPPSCGASSAWAIFSAMVSIIPLFVFYEVLVIRNQSAWPAPGLVDSLLS
jgi:hypothetical protein